MKRTIYSPAAKRDLREIALYIADDNPERARTFVAELRAKAQSVAERPFSFPSRDDLRPNLRAARHGRYLIFFVADEAEVQIVRVLHAMRDLQQTFGV